MCSWSPCFQCRLNIGDGINGMCSTPSEDENIFHGITHHVHSCRDICKYDSSVGNFVCDHCDPMTTLEYWWENTTQMYWYPVVRKAEAVKDFIRFSIIGRMKHKFDPRDCWDLGSATAKFMLPRLRKFIDDKPMGYPSQLADMNFIRKHKLLGYFRKPIDYDWFHRDNDDGDDEFAQAWINILEHMYRSVKTVTDDFYGNSDISEPYNNDVENKKRHNTEKGLGLIGVFFQNLWD